MADVVNAMANRVNHPVSTSELERRWAVTRKAMERESIDVLLLRNDSQWFSGGVKYLTDVPPKDYGLTVVFPRSGDMTIVEHGDLGGDRALPSGGDWMYRGVGRVLTSSFFRSVHYTRAHDAELAVAALREYDGGTVGLVAVGDMPFVFTKHVEENLPGVSFVDATDLVDDVKAIKSDEEQALIRATARLQDEAMEAAFAFIKPGRREREVTAVIQQVAESYGSETGIIAVGSGRYGGGWTINDPHFQNRAIETGDVIIVMIEVNGPGGLFCELSRTAVLGSTPAPLAEDLEILLEAQRLTCERLVPGADCKEIWDAHNAFLRAHSRPEEARIHCHGQGVDMVERPLVRFDEPMRIREGMLLAVHPAWTHEGVFSWVCDNVLIGPDGPTARLHAFSPEILEL